MKKVSCVLIILIMLSSMSNSSSKINLEDYLNSFLWEKRIVLLIANENNTDLINETKFFFKNKSCENELRNLKLITIIGDEINNYIIPNRHKKKSGIWLIGYDGEYKSFSKDKSFLKEIHNIIDTMPIRKREMIEQNKKCN